MPATSRSGALTVSKGAVCLQEDSKSGTTFALADVAVGPRGDVLQPDPVPRDH